MNFEFKNNDLVVLSTKVTKEFRAEIEKIAKKEQVKASNVVLAFLEAAYKEYKQKE